MLSWRSMLLFARHCVLVVGFVGIVEAGEDAADKPVLHVGTSAASFSEALPLPADPALPYPEPAFVGSYCPSGRFKEASKLDTWAVDCGGEETLRQRLHAAEVPKWINLHDPSETIVEDRPGAKHARRPLKTKSKFMGFLESFSAAAYGRHPVLHSPVHVTTDSHQRLIVSDPKLPGIHILNGTTSIRIAGGPAYRLRHPNGIAVDGNDNIYVADGGRGTILVYSPDAVFLRELGLFQDEPMFQEPTGVAIDRTSGHLYVLDTPASELVEMDLQGNVVRRAGGRRSLLGVHLDHPTELALRDSAMVVLDQFGTRVTVLDLDGKLIHAFRILPLKGESANEIGLGLQSGGQICVTSAGERLVRCYSRNGQVLGGFGRHGLRAAEFRSALGLWIDGSDRFYVADTSGSKVQVFQHAPRAAASGNGTPAPPATRGSQ